MILGPTSEYLGLGQHEKTSQRPFLLVFFDFSSLCFRAFFCLLASQEGRQRTSKIQLPYCTEMCILKQALKYTKAWVVPFCLCFQMFMQHPAQWQTKRSFWTCKIKRPVKGWHMTLSICWGLPFFCFPHGESFLGSTNGSRWLSAEQFQTP